MRAQSQVAAQGQIGRPAVYAAVNRCDRGQRQALDSVKQRFEAAFIELLGDGRQGVARAEGLGAVACDDHDPHPGVGLDRIEMRHQHRHIVWVDPVVLRGAIQPNGGAGAVDGQQGGGVGGRWVHGMNCARLGRTLPNPDQKTAAWVDFMLEIEG